MSRNSVEYSEARMILRAARIVRIPIFYWHCRVAPLSVAPIYEVVPVEEAGGLHIPAMLSPD